MRLTAELVNSVEQRLNPLLERELVLRGLQIPAIENLGATKDQYDSIDLTDNDLVRLDNFPLLKRLASLYLCHNNIRRIDDDLHEYLPNLTCLIMDSNEFSTFEELSGIAKFSKLERLSILDNPVTHIPNYHLYLISILPNLKVLNFSKVKPADRESANEMFKDMNIGDVKESSRTGVSPKKLTNDQKRKLLDAIKNSKSLDEVERFQHILQSGIFPDEGL